MIAHAFYRIESALTICLTILLAFFLSRPFPWWRWGMWVILGAIAEGFIIYTSLTDERTGEAVVADLLRERYDPGAIKTKPLREKLEQALQYREGIQQAAASAPAGALRDHLADSVAGIAEWIGQIYGIAQRLDAYARDEITRRDLNEAPQSLARLQRSLAQETDAAVRAQIEATIQAKQAQLGALRELQNRMEQAQFRLEETLTALGTVYSQYQLLGARKLSDARAQRLAGDITDQVQRLRDILAAMDEVYAKTS